MYCYGRCFFRLGRSCGGLVLMVICGDVVSREITFGDQRKELLPSVDLVAFKVSMKFLKFTDSQR